MRIKVLVDNNTLIDNYYYGEPGVSFYLEDSGEKILFDTGYSRLFMENAKAMNIDLGEINKIVISHGHNDHTGGLAFLKDSYLYAHPLAFKEKKLEGLNIGSPLSEEEITRRFKTVFSKEPQRLSQNLYYLGEIPRVNDFEAQSPLGLYKEGSWQEDFLFDDTAIAYKAKEGLYIITGCSHSGICNIMERAKEVCGCNTIKTVLGGFHLFDIGKELHKTIEYFAENNIKEIYPCHCVSLKVKAHLSKFTEVREVGVNLDINW